MMLVDSPGMCVVMFKADTCAASTMLLPVFEELECAEKRIQFSIMNVGNARRLITSSQMSTTPLKTTPTVILYTDGKPRAIYKGKKDLQSILQFIVTMVQKIGISETPFVRTAPEPQRQQQYVPQQQYAHNYGGAHTAVDPTVIKHYRNAGGQISHAAIKQQREEDASFGLHGEIPYNAPWQMLDQ